MTAKYIDIKRFAVHDGPGIRTTLFLKGCPLACVWCHNPESISLKPELGIHEMKCTRCGDCAKICKCHEISETTHGFHREPCTACGKCVDHCLFGALELFGQTITPEKAAARLLEDKAFYTNGGGVTVSGGEPLLQSEFCAELFRILKRENIHCAVDTCGNVPWSAFETVIPDTDLFLYDFKEIDSAKHKTFTGCGNERILENLKKLDAAGKPIDIRMIQVPGFNMDDSDLHGAGKFLSELKHLTAVRLLAYHPLAHSKYRAVGRPDTLPGVESPTFDDLEKSAKILRTYGLNTINSLTK